MKTGPSSHLTAVEALLRQGGEAAKDPSLDGEARLALQRAAMSPEQPVSDESVRLIPLEIAGREAEWAVAPGADPDARLLMIHGGGFCLGGLNAHRNTAIEVSKASGAAVLAIDYRLAPEHPFPAAIEDCVAAWEHLVSTGPDGAGDATHAFVMGDSAGGNLAAVVMLKLRDDGGRQADGGILMSPWMDLTLSGASMEANGDSDPVIYGPEMLSEMAAWYLQGQDPENPLASPSLADLSKLPPLLIMAGEGERLRDDAVRFHERAISARVISRLELWPHVYHAWTSMSVAVPEATEAIRRMGEFVRMEVYKTVATARFAEFKDLSDAMAENAMLWPGHLAVIDGDTKVTWAEFDKRLNKMANALIARGIRPDDKVAALARNSLDYMVVMFGTLRAGACIVPLSGMASPEALASMMENSDAKLLFVEEQYRDRIDPVREGITGVMEGGFVGFDFSDDQWAPFEDFTEGASDEHPGVIITPDLGFNIIYSSGTTGMPKGILHARRMRYGEFPAGARTGYSPWARTLVSTPLYSNSSMAALFQTMDHGG